MTRSKRAVASSAAKARRARRTLWARLRTHFPEAMDRRPFGRELARLSRPSKHKATSGSSSGQAARWRASVSRMDSMPP